MGQDIVRVKHLQLGYRLFAIHLTRVATWLWSMSTHSIDQLKSTWPQTALDNSRNYQAKKPKFRALTFGLFLIILARTPNSSVPLVSASLYVAGEIAMIRDVFALPPFHTWLSR